MLNSPGLAVELGPSIPMTLREFPTPMINSITVNAMTTTVMGNAGLCEVCRVDFYLDDFDGMPDVNQEALEWLGFVEVNVPARWQHGFHPSD
ncbi:hypothetical protein C2W62_21540 [Candidatus Entotheonella serta]|nr:hypothetical protein C2W62_21540 [Candidatus Entotheonella serta]